MSSEAAIEAYNDAGSANVSLRLRGSDFKFFTTSTERLRILSDGKVAIGGVTANSLLDVHGGDGISITHSGDTFLQSRTTGTTGTNYLEFKDSGGGSGAISYHHDGNSMRFKTGGSERLRITDVGDVLLGSLTTKNDGRNAKGVTLKSPAGISFQNYGSNGSRNWRIRPDDLSNWGSLEFSVSPTDNDNTDWPDASGDVVLELKKDKDVVVSNGNLVIGTSGQGIDFSATSDGPSMASELLDDYEEGTFTPTVSVENQSDASTDKNYGRYVKVGKMVTVWCYVQLNGTPSGRGVNNAWQHGGLPFSQRNTAGGFDIPGSILYWTLDSSANMNGTAPYHLVPRLFNNSSGGRIRAHDSSNNQYGQNASYLLKDNTEYTYTFTYEVG